MNSKICTVCKIDKLYSEFHKTKKNITGCVAQCKSCRSEKMKTLYIESETRKISVNNRTKLQKDTNRRLLNRYKSFCKCYFCKESEPVALDLHHLDPKSKDYNPAHMIVYPTEKLKKEIRKCIVLCSNCHRKVHAGILNLSEFSSVD